MVPKCDDGCVFFPIPRYHLPHTHHSDSYIHFSFNAGSSGTCLHVHFAPLLLPYRAPELGPMLVDVSPKDSAMNGTMHEKIRCMSGSPLEIG